MTANRAAQNMCAKLLCPLYLRGFLRKVVGATGFEPATPCARKPRRARKVLIP